MANKLHMVLIAALLTAAPAGSALAGSSTQGIEVAKSAALVQAIRDAKPGDKILIAPGRYKTRLRFTAANSGTEAEPIVITARDGPGTVVIDGSGGSIAVKFSGASHILMRALDVTGANYHGVFFDVGAHHITLDGSRIYDNHARHPIDSHAEVKGSGPRGRPRHISITNNEIFHTTHPPGGNFQGIDCNFCSDFLIADNYLHDIGQPTAEPFSHYDRGSCIQMKSVSIGTVIERNRFERCHIGIVYGGEGMESPEHVGGIVRDNVIVDSGEIGIAVVNVRDGKVTGNTVTGSPESIRIARDVRYPDGANEVDVADNILDVPIKSVGDAKISLRDNRILSPGAPGNP